MGYVPPVCVGHIFTAEHRIDVFNVGPSRVSPREPSDMDIYAELDGWRVYDDGVARRWYRNPLPSEWATLRESRRLAPVIEVVVSGPVHVYPTAEESLHDLDGGACFCKPEEVCANCRCTGPCICGQDRPTVIVHREAS